MNGFTREQRRVLQTVANAVLGLLAEPAAAAAAATPAASAAPVPRRGAARKARKGGRARKTARRGVNASGYDRRTGMPASKGTRVLHQTADPALVQVAWLEYKEKVARDLLVPERRLTEQEQFIIQHHYGCRNGEHPGRAPVMRQIGWVCRHLGERYPVVNDLHRSALGKLGVPLREHLQNGHQAPTGTVEA